MAIVHGVDVRRRMVVRIHDDPDSAHQEQRRHDNPTDRFMQHTQLGVAPTTLVAAVPETGTSDCLRPKCRGERFSLAIGRTAVGRTLVAMTPLRLRRQARFRKRGLHPPTRRN